MRNPTRRTACLTVLGLIVLSGVAEGCKAPEADDSDSSEGAVTKADLKERFADLRKINTRNLSAIAVNLGAEGINKALSLKSSYADLGVTIGDTNVFGVAAEDNPLVPGSGKVKSLNDVQGALASTLGDKEFPTELAKIRLAHLAEGQDNFFVETSFGLRGALGLAYNHTAGGFGAGDVSVSVGFKKGQDVEARVIVATPTASLATLLQSNGEAIEQLRAPLGGFVIPEKADDIVKMKAGESFGMRGQGTFAANFGIGVPILIADAGPFAYTLAVSAGLTHSVTGTLDVQLVRLTGDEVAVDVGISEAQIDDKSLGVTGSWGVNQQCDDGSLCLDAGIAKIVRNALGKRLGTFMKSSIAVASAKGSTRLELARARFHMSQPEVPAALEQALHGDLRYAQALYSRSLSQTTQPVVFDFDMMRASMTNSLSFGAEVFGIDIYHRVAVEKTGAFAVQTPDGVQSVLWNSFQKRSGWFQMDHGSQLTALSSAAINASDPDKVSSRANFIAQTVVGDKHMDDDMLLDSTDALIVSIAGKDALAALDKYGTPMEEAIGRECPIQKADPNGTGGTADRDTWDEACNVNLIADPTKKVVRLAAPADPITLVDARTNGVAEFLAQPSVSSKAPAFRDLLSAAATLRLTLQMVKIHSLDSNNGPGVSFALNYRLDNKALNLLATVDPDQYGAAVTRYFTTVGAPRTGIKTAKPISDGDAKKGSDAMVALLKRYQSRYKNLSENETSDLPRILADKPYIKLPIGIRFDVSDVADPDSPERMKQFIDDVNRIRVESMTHQRALMTKDLFDNLTTAADKNVGFGNGKSRLFAEQAAGYSMVSVIPGDNLDVGLDLAADVSSSFWAKRERFIKAGFAAVGKSARGSQVEPITSNLFDLDKMMNAP